MNYSELSDEELIAEYKKECLSEVINMNMQMAMKILLNGGYGALGNIWFLYFKLENAEAITLTGQAVNRFVNTRLEKFLQKLCKTDEKFWVMADTDSGYFNMEPVVKILCKGVEDKQLITDKLDKFAKEICQPEINRLTNEFAEYLNSDVNAMVYEREVIADTAIVVAKKKYVMSVIDSEGTRYKSPKFKITGMESKKSSTPGWSREFLKECYIIGLTGGEKALQKRVEEIRDSFSALPIKTIAIPSGMNGMKDYMDSEGGYVKGTPIAVKSAIIHNRLVDKLDIPVNKLQSGNKLKYVQLKHPNPIHEDVVGFESHLPKEFGLDQYVDREAIFDKAFISPLKIFLTPIKWNYEETVTLEDFFG